MSRRLNLRISVALIVAGALALGTAPALAQMVSDSPAVEEADERPALALMGTIPIYWGETHGSFRDLVTGNSHPHWARAQLERDFDLRPLDYLTPEALAPFKGLLMAQPRGLTPEENVALDDWVRAGGRLLLFADPEMTGHSHFPLGDRRRPQDTALLSPILAHWGLELMFDVDQATGVQMRGNVGEGDSAAIPVNRAGQFLLLGEDAACRLNPPEILAFCALGEGQAVILADAALLDIAGPIAGAQAALQQLQDLAFAPLREEAGLAGLAANSADKSNENQGYMEASPILAMPSTSPAIPPPDP